MNNKITNKTIEKIKYDLVREGLLDYNQLIEAIEQTRKENKNLAQILIENNILKEETLLHFLEQKLHIPYVNLDDYTPDLNIMGIIDKNDAFMYKIVPLFVIEGTLTLAMSDPLDLFTLNNILKDSNYKVEPVLCSERSIIKTLEELYKNQSQESINKSLSIDSLSTKVLSKFNWQSELTEDKNIETNFYKLFKALIYQAINEDASEIHLEQKKDDLCVRFRITSFMHDRGSIPILLAPKVISKLKVTAGLDPEEFYEPQHGKIDLNIDKNIINTLISTFPTVLGERIIIKILANAPPINQLGLEDDQISLFAEAMKQRNGLIIALGPNGFGQKTTFYSILENLSDNSFNVMTLESCIRYSLPNINQSQINNLKDFNYDKALRALFQQEPDIIYIDELSTAHDIELICKNFASNKLIMTTINAVNITNIPYRLNSLGISLKQIANNINLLFSQKLVKKLCPKCKIEYNPTEYEVTQFDLPITSIYYIANGCDHCNNFGYKGMTSVFETVSFNKNLKELFSNDISEPDFIGYLKDKNHKTLYDNTLSKVKSGLISFEEIKLYF